MKLMMTILALFVAAPLAAQTQTIVSYAVDVTLSGASAPMQSTTIPASAVLCNQTKPTTPTGVVYNPKKISWDDDVNAGKSCIVDQSTFLLGLPIPGSNQTYTLTVAGVDTLGLTMARSAASGPFSRANPLPARTAVQVSQ